MPKQSLVLADTATKGGALGIVSFLCSEWNIDPAFNVIIVPVVLYLLHAASTWFGDPTVANFFVKNEDILKAVMKETMAKPTSVTTTKKVVNKNKKK
jgi:hypothetical protein